MTDQRYIVVPGQSAVPVWYVKDTRVPDGFQPVVICLTPRETYADMIAEALNAQKRKSA